MAKDLIELLVAKALIEMPIAKDVVKLLIAKYLIELFVAEDQAGGAALQPPT